MTTPTPDMVECSTCLRWFNNTDGTRVCPTGHENRCEGTDDDGYGEPYLRKVVG